MKFSSLGIPIVTQTGGGEGGLGSGIPPMPQTSDGEWISTELLYSTIFLTSQEALQEASEQAFLQPSQDSQQQAAITQGRTTAEAGNHGSLSTRAVFSTNMKQSLTIKGPPQNVSPVYNLVRTTTQGLQAVQTTLRGESGFQGSMYTGQHVYITVVSTYYSTLTCTLQHCPSTIGSVQQYIAMHTTPSGEIGGGVVGEDARGDTVTIVETFTITTTCALPHVPTTPGIYDALYTNTARVSAGAGEGENGEVGAISPAASPTQDQNSAGEETSHTVPSPTHSIVVGSSGLKFEWTGWGLGLGYIWSLLFWHAFM
ncbi:uncharacterized protein LY89DRAFT_270207 [Mollisia scopiformis]|uniref:Uncharacterized protein n=1 Tax=Mollisia scopiformis TaxID=149040 RepID=A0A132BCZ6_MOLSC|nr:uncharacterized protein LY89DRAFT_270207 [Mollisia scopiformis]KUJ10123.1 hypothetical protein LY89DRAFT_270207 [Mollisia scopiformis]